MEICKAHEEERDSIRALVFVRRRDDVWRLLDVLGIIRGEI